MDLVRRERPTDEVEVGVVFIRRSGNVKVAEKRGKTRGKGVMEGTADSEGKSLLPHFGSSNSGGTSFLPRFNSSSAEEDDQQGKEEKEKKKEQEAGKRRGRGRKSIWKRSLDAEVSNDDDLDDYFDPSMPRKKRNHDKRNRGGYEMVFGRRSRDSNSTSGEGNALPAPGEENPPSIGSGNMASSGISLTNPNLLEDFNRDFNQLVNFPSEILSWIEPDVMPNCWVQAMLVGRFPYAPSCETDGSYSLKQCFRQRCWCVSPAGLPLKTEKLDKGQRFYFKMEAINLNCSFYFYQSIKIQSNVIDDDASIFAVNATIVTPPTSPSP